MSRLTPRGEKVAVYVGLLLFLIVMGFVGGIETGDISLGVSDLPNDR